jgi:hypothetical protein
VNGHSLLQIAGITTQGVLTGFGHGRYLPIRVWRKQNAYRTFYAISSGKCKKGKIVKLPPNAGLKSEFVAILSYGGA